MLTEKVHELNVSDQIPMHSTPVVNERRVLLGIPILHH